MGSHLTGNFNPETLGKNLLGIGARGIINAGVGQAVYGDEAGRFGDAFLSSVVGDLAAVSAHAVGQQTPAYSPQNVLGHAAVGAAAAHLRGQDAVAGAIGGLGAALINPTLDQAIGGEDGLGWGNDLASASRNQQMTLQLSSTIVSGGLAAALDRPYLTAMNAAHNETINNYLTRENILVKHQRLAAAQTAAERQRIARESRKESQENDSVAVGNAQTHLKEMAGLTAQREKYLQQLAGPLTDEATTRIKRQIVEIDRQIVQSRQTWLGQTMADRQELVALSNDQAQPEHIRQEALRNIEMIDGDLRYAQILDQHFWTVAGAAMTLPLTGGLSSIGGTLARQSLIGAGVGGGFDIAGQLYKGEEFRLGQALTATATGALAGPLAGKTWWRNAALGGSVNATNTLVTNQIYGRDDNVAIAFVTGFGASVFGTYVGRQTTQHLSKTSPVMIGNPPIPNPYPARAGFLVEQSISNIPSFINLTEEGERQ